MPDPLNRLVTIHHLYYLARVKLLSPQALEHALKNVGYLPNRRTWWFFIDKILLLLGSALTLAGVVFFFAYNWAEMNYFTKFGLLEFGMFSLVLWASWRLKQLSGQVALFSAAILLGALLAVYGQTYQTGADAFELFLGWAILIIPWVLSSCFAPLWLLLLVLFDLSFILYWQQVIDPIYGEQTTLFFLSLFLLNLFALICWEIAFKLGFSWLQGQWLGRLIFMATLSALVIPTLQVIIEWPVRSENPFSAVTLVFYALIVWLTLWYYRTYRHDLSLLALSLFSLLITITTLFSKLLPLDEGLTWLILALIVIGQAALMTKWLQFLIQTWQQQEPQMTPSLNLLHTLKELEHQHLFSFETSDTIAEVLETHQSTTPWFINLLIAISAWLSMIPLIVFLFLVHFIETTQSNIMMGLLFLLISIGLFFTKRQNLFFNQLALALNLTGQVLLMIGLSLQLTVLQVALLIVTLEIFLISLYDDQILRFLSILIAILALIVLLYELNFYEGIHILIVTMTAIMLWCWLNESQHQSDPIAVHLYQPLGYSTALMLLILLLPSILTEIESIPAITWFFSTLGLTLLLLFLEYHLLKIHVVQFPSPKTTFLFSSTLFIAFLFYQNPGLIAAFIVLLVGFQRSNRILISLAIIFIGLFLVAYYYHLEVNLLMKSVMLLNGGLALLGLRWVLQRFSLGER